MLNCPYGEGTQNLADWMDLAEADGLHPAVYYTQMVTA